MSMISRRRCAFTAFLLLAVLLFGGLPVHAQTNRRPPAEVRKIAVLGENTFNWLCLVVASLWHPEMAKEGPSLDPDGQPRQTSDEGMSIDPNGQR